MSHRIPDAAGIYLAMMAAQRKQVSKEKLQLLLFRLKKVYGSK